MEDKKNGKIIEGYNPRTYRSLSIIFIILTILNVAIVFVSFRIVGFGLYHAETALSCIANIDNKVGEINRNVLEISLHSDNKEAVLKNIGNINLSYESLTSNAEKFREIDLSNIDETLSDDFENTMQEITIYYNKIYNHLDTVKNGEESPEVLYDFDKNQKLQEALTSINNLFEKQDLATYDFFCKIAKRFLFVIAFLLLTMGAGLFAIQKSKKHDKKLALQIQNGKIETANIRQKAMDIAYMNIVTGLQNRYALEEELDKRIENENVIIAMYNFNGFRHINENYGRNFADEFISEAFKKVSNTVNKKANIYHTDTDELCIVFNSDISKGQANDISNDILLTLSNPVYIQKIPAQLTVAGTVYYSDKSKENLSASKLIMTLDKSMVNTKSLCHTQNKSILSSIN